MDKVESLEEKIEILKNGLSSMVTAMQELQNCVYELEDCAASIAKWAAENNVSTPEVFDFVYIITNKMTEIHCIETGYRAFWDDTLT